MKLVRERRYARVCVRQIDVPPTTVPPRAVGAGHWWENGKKKMRKRGTMKIYENYISDYQILSYI